MLVLRVVTVLVLSYLVGAIPMGYLIVKLFSGKDVRTVESGRTGGTNAMRAAGFIPGLLTVIMDMLKAYSTAFIVQWLLPGYDWLQVAAALAAILGHNYSIYLAGTREDGKIFLGGGAGGSPSLGGAMALYPPIILIVLPVAILVFVFIGYASVTTMSIAFAATLVFIYRAWMGWSPWIFVLYGVLAEIIVMWALRPNLKRLKEGNERMVGLRAYLKKKREAKKQQEG